MNYKKLGNTDLEVSTICLGTMTWGEQNTESEAFEQMDFALTEGVNFWDTAELYAVPPKKETYGHTEKIIGNWLKKNKKRPLLFNKNLIETVKKIYLERKKTYSEADFKIKCESLKPELIVNKILDLYENSRD